MTAIGFINFTVAQNRDLAMLRSRFVVCFVVDPGDYWGYSPCGGNVLWSKLPVISVFFGWCLPVFLPQSPRDLSQLVSARVFDGNPNDSLFLLKNGALFLRDDDFVVNIGPNNEVAIKPLDVNLPVVGEATFDVTIGGKAVSVKGVRLTNIQIKAQMALAGFEITSSLSKNFANPLGFGGVLLEKNAVNYPVVAGHSTSIKNTGFVDGIDLGSVTQAHSTKNGSGDFPLGPVSTSTGKAIDLAAGIHQIDSKLELTMEANSILILRNSGEGGVAELPEPSSLTLFGLAAVLLVGRGYAHQLRRIA